MRIHSEAATALVAMLGTLAFVVYAVIRFRRPIDTRFTEVLGSVNEVAVLIHPNPGPDVVATAIGVACLTEQVGAIPTIQFAGQIRHQENHVFRTVLDLDLDPIDYINDPAAEAVVLVGRNEPRGFAGTEDISLYTVIDHHPDDGTGEAFTDVRTNYGACSSIVAEYFRDVGAKPILPDMHASKVNASYTVPSQVAMGLAYGVLAGTECLTADCSTADFDAVGFLFLSVNEDHLDYIVNLEISREVLETEARAIADRDVCGPFAAADIGTISNVDTIPQTAGKLIQLKGVIATVACDEHESNVYLLGRPRDDRIHIGRTLEAALNHYRGSSVDGHARMDSGQIIRPGATTDSGNGESVPRDEPAERVFKAFSGGIRLLGRTKSDRTGTTITDLDR